ncbi:MAG: bifunctional riboflavin kinase/FAD synthetase [Anaerolineae bacterium]|nr:bifunctional riboflavin kinase/FAD synthetase [Anaerolineae bacterium]
MIPSVVRWAGERAPVVEATVMTIGVFDGVHIGHQALIGQAVDEGEREGVVSAGLTFFPSPEVVLRRQRPRYLMLPQERSQQMLALGLGLVVVTEFSSALASLSAADFMERVAYSFHPRQVWVGEDFALGRGRTGDLEALAQLGYKLGYRLRVLARRRVGGEVVSSTLIRRCLESGDVAKAASMLGRPHSVSGRVVSGDARGRDLGIPTANVDYDQRKHLPADGVYAAMVVNRGGSWPAVVNVGVRPTFAAVGRTLEAHLLDFGGDLYGEEVRVDFVARLRAETRFASPAELVEQVGRDVERARELLQPPTGVEAVRGV